MDWPDHLPPPVHQRRLRIVTRRLDGTALYVTGHLLDERLLSNCGWWEHLRPAGPIHDFELNFLLDGRPPEIVKARAFMHTFPDNLCPGLLKTAENLVGLKISSGFSRAVRNLLGGVRGCAHLTHLATVMGPAIIQGLLNADALTPWPAPDILEDDPGLAGIVGTCKLWAPEGPLTRQLRQDLSRRSPNRPERP